MMDDPRKSFGNMDCKPIKPMGIQEFIQFKFIEKVEGASEMVNQKMKLTNL